MLQAQSFIRQKGAVVMMTIFALIKTVEKIRTILALLRNFRCFMKLKVCVGNKLSFSFLLHLRLF